MKKIILFIVFCAISGTIGAQTYCLTFGGPVPEGGQFRITYSLRATTNVDASIQIDDANHNLIDIIPPAPGGLASYDGSFLSPTTAINVIDLGVLASSNGATATASCALPIELIKFQAQAVTEGNLLTWESATEINTSHFDIERSNDGKLFEKIGTTEAQGKAANYNFLDKAPLWGIGGLYYRLKINDLDGKTDYSKIVTLSQKAKGLTAKAYPNPAHDILTVDIGVEKKSDVTIELKDILGRTIWQSKAENTEGSLSLPIPLADVANGSYLLKVSNGQTTVQQKVVKN
jgi:hypothetical protein